VTVERRFRVHLRRRLDADDEAALHQAGIDVEQHASDPSSPEALLVEAADEAEAGLRVRAALGGDEDLDVFPDGG
jgi:hypothetical protein